MATPQPKSYEQILGDMLRAYQSKTGVNDLNTGSAVTSFYETVALAIARSSGDVFQILRDLSVDRARGDALKKIATDEGLRELPARVATGEITVTDTSFTKISTKVYAGANSPNVGSTTILVANALTFPSSGSVYVGRGTPNVEGPIAYTSKTQIGGYWSLTLSSPTTKFHNINESVILAQGGVRSINIGAVVVAPATGANPDIKFTVIKNAVILDGETEVTGVLVSAQEPGVTGNVPIGAIKEFNAEPFTGAKPTNALPFKTGRDLETDDELRIRIKRARLSRGLGTALAVKNAVINASPIDENATIVSSEIVTESGGMTTLYVDDGTGYEPKTSGVGIEVLVDSALGGETNFQLKTGGRQTSISKAFLISNLSGPFDIKGTDKLAISVGGTTTEHTFSTSDFVSPGGATAYEIAASINANTSLNFNALTSDGGTKVVLTAKSEKNEAIKAQGVTSGKDAAYALGLPSNEVQTLRLFKNKIPLSKDGLDASVQSEKQTNWSITIADGDTLKLSVDNTASITYTIQDADFIAEGSYTTVSSQNSLESWANVLNNKLTGVTVTIVGERLVITSNLGESDRAAVSIDPTSDLVTNGMFTQSAGLESSGQASDYQLSRNTAQIRLNTPLSPGDTLTAGTSDTEARIESVRILGGNLTLISDGYFWLLLDDPTVQSVFTGVATGTTLTVSKPSANIIRYTSNATNAFANVFVGDYTIVWSKEVNSGNRIEGRVYAKTSSTLDIKVTASEYASAVAEGPVIYQDGFVVTRTKKVPQKFKINSGTSVFLGTIADDLNLQANGCEFSVFDEEILLVKTLTKDTSGAVFVVTQDDQAKSLSLPTNELKLSSESLYAFYESEYTEGGFPLFVHSNFSTESFASPPDSYISTIGTGVTLLSEGLDPDFIVGYLQPYGTILDTLSSSETTPLSNYSGSSITIDQDKLIKRLRLSDRWYAASPLNFGANDEIVVVLDSDLSGKTFSIPLYRNVKTTSTLANNPNSFNAVDSDAGDLSFLTYFPSSFKFDNYKVLMKAKAILNPAGNENAVLFRAIQHGRSGEKINVSYIYPTAPNSVLSSLVTVDENINIKISLSSGGVIGTSIDGTTEWNVTIVPNNPVVGTDQVTYSWSGTGTNPVLALSGGEYVNIGTSSQLSLRNTGTFRISTAVGFAPTSTSFTVSRKSGEAIAEANKATLVNNNFTFYNKSTTIGLDIPDYVNNNLSNFITAELVDDSGLTGAGIIEKSTYEESGFAYESVSLKDGLNWIASTNLSGSPQFTFKIPLTVYNTATAGGTYGFNDGEEIKFVPTNLDQLVKFINTLAVTGYTTVGGAIASQRGGKLELSTQVLGGSGAIQVVGGKANTAETPVLGSSSIYNNQYMLCGIDKSGIDGLHSDQWVKLEASNTQKKSTLFKTSLNIQIESDTPPATGSDPKKSTITLFNKTLEDRHFGKPRHHIRTRGRTFKVEKQGKLTCVSWDGSGTQPFFEKSLNFNDSLGGTVSVEKITGTNTAEYKILTGNANFSEVSIGDIVTVQNMSNSSNDGTFLVTGISDDGKTMRLFNPYGVTAAGAAFAAGDFTCTTELSENDTVIIKEPFNVLNRGKFRVVRRYKNSFYVENPNSVEESVTDTYTPIDIEFDGTTGFDIDASENKIKLSWDGTGTEPDFSLVRPGDEITLGSDFSPSNQGSWVVFNSESTFLEAINPSAVNESGVLISDVLEIHRPSFTVFEYDATVPDDVFTISGDFLGLNNKNSWKVYEVLGPNKIVVYGTMTSVSTTSVSGQQDNLIVQEWTPFSGYKKIHLVTVDPASINQRGILVFDTPNQADKINQAASVQVSAVGKLQFSETIRRGLDSYRFDTGIIGEANRIVYGEPRDVTSYPGVAAAGAEIFIRPPLIKRVQVGIAVRLETGIPFFQIVEQVRTNVSALINGNPIGTPIAISDIVSVVNIIQGVKAMAITSPLYNASNDTINIGLSEKAKIIDPTNDISTTQIV